MRSYKRLVRIDTDSAGEFLSSFYSHTGRPASNQAQILRAFIVMSDLKLGNIDALVKALHADPMLVALIGSDPDHIPSLGSFYDFIARLWTLPRSEMHLGRNDLLPCDRNANAREEVIATAKSKDGIGSDGKLKPSDSKLTERCEQVVLNGLSFSSSYAERMQTLLRILGINGSIRLGLLDSVRTFSGDGTCFHSHANPNGHHRCDCLKNGISNCSCGRRFSDPGATWGYDSDLKEHFFGYTIYTLSVHNAVWRVDLPLHIRITSARRHDSVSGIISIHEFVSQNSDLSFENICLDSAHDNYPTYRLCNHWKLNPLIDLNTHRGKPALYKDGDLRDSDGTPICLAGKRMVCDGMDHSRCRIKFRCPLAAAHQDLDSCPCRPGCSPSPYGRCRYIQSKDDIRLYTPIPRGSAEYERIYKDRTSCERMNNRILNHYNLANYKGRTDMRLTFFTMLSCVCIHLDAQDKVLLSSSGSDPAA